MKKVHGISIAVAAATLVAIAGCATSHFGGARKPADENFEQLNGNYDKIHPIYAVECASSKFDEKGEKPGGPYGHSFLYLKGACRDTSDPHHLKIKVCDPGTDLTNPESGVGLALDKTFQNTRYVAIDGFNFLITGDLAKSASLDNQAFDDAVRKFVAAGYAQGIILTPKDEADKKNPAVNKGDPNMSDEEWVAREVIGSSFAVDFARELGCVAVPVTPEMLQAGVDYVNTQNEPFVSGKKKFKWDPVSDQCVQFAHNVFASMGIGKHITVSSDHNFLVSWGLKAFDFSTFVIPFVRTRMPAPVNEADKLDQETEGATIFSLLEAYNNKTVRANFMKFKQIPATDGVLIWQHDQHSTDNQYFNVGDQLMPVDLPVIKPITHTYRRLIQGASTSMIEANLSAYQEKLQLVLSSMDINTLSGRHIPVAATADYCDAAGDNKKVGSDFSEFCLEYTKYLLDSKANAVKHMGDLINLQ